MFVELHKTAHGLPRVVLSSYLYDLMDPLREGTGTVAVHVAMGRIPDQGVVRLRAGHPSGRTEVIGDAEAGVLVRSAVPGAPGSGDIRLLPAPGTVQRDVGGIHQVGLPLQVLPLALPDVIGHIAGLKAGQGLVATIVLFQYRRQVSSGRAPHRRETPRVQHKTFCVLPQEPHGCSAVQYRRWEHSLAAEPVAQERHCEAHLQKGQSALQMPVPLIAPVEGPAVNVDQQRKGAVPGPRQVQVQALIWTASGIGYIQVLPHHPAHVHQCGCAFHPQNIRGHSIQFPMKAVAGMTIIN